MSNDTMNLLERLQTRINLDTLGEDRASIESALDKLGDTSGTKLEAIWRQEVRSKKGMSNSKLDVIDDIMHSRFGKEYNRYLKGEVGETILYEGDNIYLRMPINRVIEDAKHGVSDARKAWYARDLEGYRKEFGNVAEPKKESKLKEKKYDYNCPKCKYKTGSPSKLRKGGICPECDDKGFKVKMTKDLKPSSNESKLKEDNYSNFQDEKLVDAYNILVKKVGTPNWNPDYSKELAKIMIELKKRGLQDKVTKESKDIEDPSAVPADPPVDTAKAGDKLDIDPEDSAMEDGEKEPAKKNTQMTEPSKKELEQLIDKTETNEDVERKIRCEKCGNERTVVGSLGGKDSTIQYCSQCKSQQSHRVKANKSKTDEDKDVSSAADSKEDDSEETEKSRLELFRLLAKSKSKRKKELNKSNEDTATMFAQDKVDVYQSKVDGLKAQAKQLEQEQRGTKKSSRGYTLQNIYAAIDDYEKKIAQAKSSMGEKKLKETVQELVGETPGIGKLDQKILNWAISKGYIPNKFPSYQVMTSAVAKHPGSKQLDPKTVDWGKVAGVSDVQGMYLRYILLPKAKSHFKESYSETQSRFEKKQLYICNSCTKTFRNSVNECTYCESKKVEKIGILEKGYVCTKCSSGNVIESEGKIKCMDCGHVEGSEVGQSLSIPSRESKLSEQEEDNLTIIAKGIVDKREADDMARDKKGMVVADETDEKKFMVVTKVEEQKLEERNIRSQLIESFYKLGYSLSGEKDADLGRVLEFKSTGTERGPDIEVRIRGELDREV